LHDRFQVRPPVRFFVLRDTFRADTPAETRGAETGATFDTRTGAATGIEGTDTLGTAGVAGVCGTEGGAGARVDGTETDGNVTFGGGGTAGS
jgi:hypothetical protein